MSEAMFLGAIATRTAVVATAVIVGLRLFGTRELGQMNIYDLAMVMALANAVQNAMTRGSGQLLAGATSAATLLLVSGGLAAVVLRAPRLEGLLVGTPTLLAFQGQLLPEHLRSRDVTVEQVMTAVRERGLADLAEVATATLEVDGSISVIPIDTPSRRHPRVFPPHRGPTPAGEPGRGSSDAALPR